MGRASTADENPSICYRRLLTEGPLSGANGAGPPPTFKSAAVNARGYPDSRFTLQFYVDDCTGCGLCVEVCPAHSPREPEKRAINMALKAPLQEAERVNIAFLEGLPVNDRARVDFANVRGIQFLEPLFEFSGACAGCGETPLSAAALAAVRRPAAGCQCDRLLLDLFAGGSVVEGDARRDLWTDCGV